MTISTEILKLYQKLYPTGRAWNYAKLPFKYKDFSRGFLYNIPAVQLPGFDTITDFGIPTETEKNTLRDFAGGSSIAGGKLKSATGWPEGGNGTDEYGFLGYPTGYRDNQGEFVQLNSSSSYFTTLADYLVKFQLYDSLDGLGNQNLGPKAGAAIRMVYKGVGTPPSTVTDYDGNVYDVVEIGTQYWLVQNYICTHLSDGTPINKIEDKTAWLNDITGAYCAYDNNDKLALGNQDISDNDKLNIAKLRSWDRLYADIKKILDQKYPDNSNFDELDTENWERVFGLTPSSTMTIEERNEVILARQSYSKVKERQTAEYIEDQLQANGFDVYVHENRFEATPYITQCGPSQCGFSQCGGTNDPVYPYVAKEPETGWEEICANSLDPAVDATIFDATPGTQCGVAQCGSSICASPIQEDRETQLSYSFFIGGETYPNLADVPESRKNEFRELILKLKPAHLVAWLYINYI